MPMSSFSCIVLLNAYFMLFVFLNFGILIFEPKHICFGDNTYNICMYFDDDVSNVNTQSTYGHACSGTQYMRWTASCPYLEHRNYGP